MTRCLKNRTDLVLTLFLPLLVSRQGADSRRSSTLCARADRGSGVGALCGSGVACRAGSAGNA